MHCAPLCNQRHLFDIPDDIAYFNCAYNSPQLKSSRDALLAAAVRKGRPWERIPSDFFSDADAARQLAAVAFGGSADAYAIVPSASYGLAAAARAIQPTLGAHDRIAVLQDEFPANFYIWQRVADEVGASIQSVPKPTDGDWTQALLKHISRGVRVVAVPNCHWTNGSFVDLVTIGRACRASGATLVVDATQSLAAMPMPLAEVQPGFLVAAGYKWLLCPYGFALLYVAEEWRDARPLEETWLARLGAEDFSSLTTYGHTYAAGARRFDMGETCTTLLPGALCALRQIASWSVENVSRTLGAVNHRIGAFLEARGFGLPPPHTRCPHMFGATLPENCDEKFVSKLRAKQVFVSQRGNSIRFAPHLHVSENDMARLFVAVEDALR